MIIVREKIAGTGSNIVLHAIISLKMCDGKLHGIGLFLGRNKGRQLCLLLLRRLKRQDSSLLDGAKRFKIFL